MSELSNFERYMQLSDKTQGKVDPKDEDLDEMDALWEKLTKEEQDKARKHIADGFLKAIT